MADDRPLSSIPDETNAFMRESTRSIEETIRRTREALRQSRETVALANRILEREANDSEADVSS
jgi:hypothetical protein